MNSKVAGVHSMTGYGSATRDHELGRLSLELRSVNSRFLDVAFRLPDELRVLEPVLRDALALRVGRGKVDCRASVQRRGAASSGSASTQASAVRPKKPALNSSERRMSIRWRRAPRAPPRGRRGS